MKNLFHKKKKLRVKAITLTILCSLSILLYSLANRYLIEHVEAVEVSPSNEITSTGSTIISPEDILYDVTSDEWNYSSSSISIQIDKVEEGIGSDLITYYVADIILDDITNLSSAFAKGLFGSNIVEPTSTIASTHDAIFAINGDYYGFRDDGIVIRNGVIYRDEPIREGLSIYSDGTITSYDETTTSAEELIANGVIHTLSFGPTLISKGNLTTDFVNISIDKNIGNRSIQDANPRTGIGMISANHFVFVVVDGRRENYSRGMTLNEFANLFQELGCVEAYNLDGGGSSTMYFMGELVNNPLGKNKERNVSDILYIYE